MIHRGSDASQSTGQPVFRIEGFDFPQDRYPDVWPWPQVTIGGDKDFACSSSGVFFDGLTQNAEGKTVYADSGKPVEIDANGCLIAKPVAQDGSLEYNYAFSFMDDSGAWLGKEIVVNFTGFGVQSTEKAGMSETLVEGNWELRWTLEGADLDADSITITPNAEIGDSGVVLMEATIGQKTLETAFQLGTYWDGWKTLEPFPQGPVAIRMKDGTEILCATVTEDYQDIDDLVCRVTSNMHDGIVDLSQVESIKFRSGWEQDAPVYTYVPIA